jgi:succinate-semialdehyde dehydrogenase/glutarate-semialdehyde dehydrogenase
MKSINPSTDELIGEYPPIGSTEIDSIINSVDKEYGQWKRLTIEQRAFKMKSLAEHLRNSLQLYAETITKEMGKPITESRAEVEKSAWVCSYYANHAVEILKDELLVSDAGKSFVSFEPIGVILAVMPWNFPFWQVFRFAAPALMAGNAAVLKHASNVMGCAQLIEQSFRKSGFPRDLFRNLQISSQQVAEVIENPKIKATTLTGSEWAGSEVAKASGKNLKKTVLELGGADAFIVLDDADLKEAAHWGVTSRMLNNGQSCIAAKRFILHKDIADKFIEMVLKELDKWTMGNPLIEQTRQGPLARPDLQEDLLHQINDALDKGATLICGGKSIGSRGNYFEPTVVKDITAEMKLYSEETFGPVFSIFCVDDEEEAIKLANDCNYGLGGSIWTQDIEKGEALARRIETGAVFINGMTKSDPRLPFGGIKKSGYGRELSHYGIKEFVNIKTIWIK